MAQSEAHRARVMELDELLRPVDNVDDHHAFLAEDGLSFHGLYSRLLSTLAVMTDGETVEYAQARTDSVATDRDGLSVHVAVFTDRRVVVADIPDIAADGAAVEVVSVSRSALVELTVSASMRQDAKAGFSAAWPGVLSISARYAGWDEAVSVTGRAIPPASRDDGKGPVWRLLDSLRTDLRP